MSLLIFIRNRICALIQFVFVIAMNIGAQLLTTYLFRTVTSFYFENCKGQSLLHSMIDWTPPFCKPAFKLMTILHDLQVQRAQQFYQALVGSTTSLLTLNFIEMAVSATIGGATSTSSSTPTADATNKQKPKQQRRSRAEPPQSVGTPFGASFGTSLGTQSLESQISTPPCLIPNQEATGSAGSAGFTVRNTTTTLTDSSEPPVPVVPPVVAPPRKSNRRTAAAATATATATPQLSPIGQMSSFD